MSIERKADLEYKELCKIGVPENMAYLIACHKYAVNEEEVNDMIQDVKEQQKEIQESLKDFLPLKDNLHLVESLKSIERTNNLISNININKDDQNENKNI